MPDLRTWFFGVVLSGLFFFAFISFANNLSLDNDTNVSILNNDAINRSFGDVNTSLASIKDSVEANKENFLTNIPVVGEISIVLTSIVGITSSVFSGFISDVFTILFEIIKKGLGIDNNVVFGVFSALFILTFIFLAWKVYRTGS